MQWLTMNSPALITIKQREPSSTFSLINRHHSRRSIEEGNMRRSRCCPWASTCTSPEAKHHRMPSDELRHEFGVTVRIPWFRGSSELSYQENQIQGHNNHREALPFFAQVHQTLGGWFLLVMLQLEVTAYLWSIGSAVFNPQLLVKNDYLWWWRLADDGRCFKMVHFGCIMMVHCGWTWWLVLVHVL